MRQHSEDNGDDTRASFLRVMTLLRASKLPFKNFEYNIRRAKALAHLDGYLEDLIHHEGKRTIGVFLDIPKEMMQSLGIDDFMKDLEKALEAHFKAEVELRGKEHFEKIAKAMIRRLKPRIEKISEIFEDLGLVMDQTLREQALIVAVSAFEVYLREISVSIVALNPYIRRKFTPEINTGLSRARLEDYKEDAKRAQGEIIADLVKLDPRKMKGFLKKLVGMENIFGTRQTEEKVRKILEHRHIVIHRAGLIDPKFKKTTQYKGAIDNQVTISRRYVLESIGILEEMARRVEVAILHAAKCLDVEKTRAISLKKS